MVRVSNDGLVRSYSETGDSFLDSYNRICQQSAERKTEWIKMLRANGIKMSHPDDGWVNRENFSIHPCYPDFNDGVKVGDEICLGSPSNEWNHIVTVTRIDNPKWAYGPTYYFTGYTGQES